MTFEFMLRTFLQKSYICFCMWENGQKIKLCSLMDNFPNLVKYFHLILLSTQCSKRASSKYF